MSDTEGFVAVDPARAAIMDAVCLRVTMLEMGAVNSFEKAPAKAPTLNSSRTGREVAFPPCFWRRRVRM